MPAPRLVLCALLVLLLGSPLAQAYDNGPQVVGCDFRLGKSEGVDRCLITGSGTNQGITWVVFELKGQRYRFEDSSPTVLELITPDGKTQSTRKIKNHPGPCRAGGRDADVYQFDNGDRICLYWP